MAAGGHARVSVASTLAGRQEPRLLVGMAQQAYPMAVGGPYALASLLILHMDMAGTPIATTRVGGTIPGQGFGIGTVGMVIGNGLRLTMRSSKNVPIRLVKNGETITPTSMTRPSRSSS